MITKTRIYSYALRNKCFVNGKYLYFSFTVTIIAFIVAAGIGFC